MGKLSPSPKNFLHARRRNTSLPEVAGTGGAVARVAPSNVARFFGSASDAGVELYGTAMEGAEFKILWQDGPNLVEVARSTTPWTIDSTYLHTDPAFGQPDVRYHLEAKVSDAWARVGSVTLDLSGYTLEAPTILVDNSHFNTPYVHVEIDWEGELEELDFFQFEWFNDPIWELLVRQPDKIAHVEMESPPADQITVRVRADGLRLGASPYSGSATLEDAGSVDGEPDGDPSLRARVDHRVFTPNLVFNSSFEYFDALSGLAKQWNGAQTEAEAWADKDRDRYCTESDATQVVSARYSSTDYHSLSVQSKEAGGTISVIDEDGVIIATITAVSGLNTIENFRVPSTHGSFTLRLVVAPGGAFDKIQVNQGPTVDPWAPHYQDRLQQTVADLETIAVEAQSNFDIVYGLLGGVSGSVIQQLDDQINLVVGHLEGTQTGSFAWIQLTDDSISQLVQDLDTAEGAITLAQANILANTTRSTDNETGIITLGGTVSTNTAAIADLETDLLGATTDITQISDLVFDPVTGNTALKAGITATATTVANIQDGLHTAEVSIAGLTTTVVDVENGLTAVEAEIDLAAGSFATIGDRFFEAESGISLNTSLVTTLDGDLSAIESTVVVKAVSTGPGLYELAVVSLSAGLPGSGNITLAAEKIDMFGVVEIMGYPAYVNSLNGGVLENETVSGELGGALKIHNILGVGNPAKGFIGGNGTHFASDGTDTRVAIQPYSPFFFSRGTAHVNVTNAGVQAGGNTSQVSYLLPDGIRVQDGGQYSILTANSLIVAGTQVAANTTSPTVTDTNVQLNPGDEDNDPGFTTVKVVDPDTMADPAQPAEIKFDGSGIEFRHFDDGGGGFNPSGTPTYKVMAPQTVSVPLTGIDSVSVGMTFTSGAVSITDRLAANYAAVPNPTMVEIGQNASGETIFGRIDIHTKTPNSFKVSIKIPPVSTRAGDSSIDVTVI